MADPIVLYQTDDGQITLDVQIRDETVWLTQTQMVELFQRDKRTVSEHIRNIFKEGELCEEEVVRKSRTTAADGKSYRTAAYNLDVVISVGYRVKSQRGTQFRIWATSVLKEYLVLGAALKQRRLAEKGSRRCMECWRCSPRPWSSSSGQRYRPNGAQSGWPLWADMQLLLQYDEDRLALPAFAHPSSGPILDLAAVRRAIDCLRIELTDRGETTALFGQERGDCLAGLLGAIDQTFDGQDLYPTIEEKAAPPPLFRHKRPPPSPTAISASARSSFCSTCRPAA